MKKASITVILILSAFLFEARLSAQTWNELFRQKETQKKYLLLQVGALKIQSGLLNEAGQIAEFGLNAIGTWRNLEKGLHEDFFISFKRLGPLSNRALEKLHNSGLHPLILRDRIRKSELQGLSLSKDQLFLHWNSKVHQGMLRRCEFFLAELNLILGNNLEMDDNDRSALLDSLGRDILQLHRDLSQVQKSVQFRLASQRFQEYQLQLLNRY